jgi:hypothetical protein
MLAAPVAVKEREINTFFRLSRPSVIKRLREGLPQPA